MPDFTKSEMRTLRRLADAAWDSELREVLEALHHSFGEWERGSLSSFELSDRIHKFHDGDARDLYKFYTGGNPSQSVAHALAYNHIDPSDVPDKLLAKLTPAVTFFVQEAKRMP
jgi:hypothetical protein